MVYDRTDGAKSEPAGERGYAIHESQAGPLEVEGEITQFEIYTDDGRGNGDFVCKTPSREWAFKIAQLLDEDLTVEERFGR